MRLRPASKRILLSLPILISLVACTGRTRPEEVREVPREMETEFEIRNLAKFPGVEPNTLWRLEADYQGSNGEVLSKSRVEVALVFDDWRSPLAPIEITPGYTYLRETGEFGDGPPDLYSVLYLSPEPLTMRMTQRIVPLNKTDPIPIPPGAKKLQARLIEVCPLKVRFMKQINRRPVGDVIPGRRVREEMHWREYRIDGACRNRPAGLPQ